MVDWAGLQDAVGSAKGGHLHAGKAMYQAAEQPGSSAVLIQLQHARTHTDMERGLNIASAAFTQIQFI